MRGRDFPKHVQIWVYLRTVVDYPERWTSLPSPKPEAPGRRAAVYVHVPMDPAWHAAWLLGWRG